MCVCTRTVNLTALCVCVCVTCRDLAHELGHPWAEYWDFLDSFVDLVSVEGLWRLEEFLSKKDFSERARDQAGELNNSNKFRTPSPGKENTHTRAGEM